MRERDEKRRERRGGKKRKDVALQGLKTRAARGGGHDVNLSSREALRACSAEHTG